MTILPGKETKKIAMQTWLLNLRTSEIAVEEKETEKEIQICVGYNICGGAQFIYIRERSSITSISFPKRGLATG